jgi:hypothetical protein
MKEKWKAVSEEVEGVKMEEERQRRKWRESRKEAGKRGSE